MPVIIDQVAEGKPGDELLVGSTAEDGRAAVVFEDDGETGYFYACETVNGPILDALHIYNVKAVRDRDVPSEFKIGWSSSSRQAVLLINGFPHAVFDFESCNGWCRNAFPPSNGNWSVDGHGWDDDCLRYFR